MFDVGFWELVLIFIVLLLVVGPDKLPGVVRTIGLYVGKARAIVAGVRAEVERELQLDEVKRSIRNQVPADELRKLGDSLRGVRQDVEQSAEQTRKATAAALSDPPPAIAPADDKNTAAKPAAPAERQDSAP